MPVIASACAACGTPLPAPAPRCGRCLRAAPPWDGAACAFGYECPVDHLLRQLKYAGKLDIARGLGEAAAVVLRRQPHARLDAVVPVPLHWRRGWRRGFNQALELARPLSRALRLPLRPGLLHRPRATREQASLSARARFANLRHAFRVGGDVDGARLIVFDDVVTTGATAGAAVRALRDAGAREVLVWGCARAVTGPPAQRPGA